MTKSILTLALAMGLSLAMGGTASANTGVAFVHGTGSQTDAANDYWTWTNINSVRQGLPDSSKYVVINCDFNQYMWTSAAAGCLAGQLTTFIQQHGITDLVVNTHSNGGNVMRWILSNPTWDSRYPAIIDAIRWVNAIAPSSAGTPLADAVVGGSVLEQAMGWLAGYATNAVKQQQQSWMASYNQDWLYGTSGRPSTPKGFWAVVGDGLEPPDTSCSWWDVVCWWGVVSYTFSEVYDALASDTCGGKWYNAGLVVTAAGWMSGIESDGFLPASSQSAAGYTWFTADLSHHQSRRNCGGLDVSLRNDL